MCLATTDSVDEQTSTAQPELMSRLVDALQCLPGVGQKSAQRMALHLLERDRHRGLHLADILAASMMQIKHCQQCRLHTEKSLCGFCSDQKRDQRLICVVETAADVMAIEQTQLFKGRYFVLHGRISPLDGIGPRQVGCDQLMHLLEHSHEGDAAQAVEEVILACSLTVEGEATTYYITEAIKTLNLEYLTVGIKVSRLAQGIPLGSDLELMNGSTLAYALAQRQPMACQ